MDKNQLQDDISFIRNMIDNNRRALVDNGITYISIGIYVFTGVIVTFILNTNGIRNAEPVIWLILMALLIVFNFTIQRKFQKKQAKKTFALKVFTSTWTACGTPIFIVSVLYLTTGCISATSLFIIVSSILGIGYFLTGIINELKFMTVSAFVWWLGTVAAILWKYVGEEYQLSLLFAVLIFILEIVPGLVIYKKWKRIYNE